MKIYKNTWKKFVFLDAPLLFLGLNYVFYNALAINELKTLLRISAILLLLVGWVLKKEYKIEKTMLVGLLFSVFALILNGTVAIDFFVIMFLSICVTYPLEALVKSAFKMNVLLVFLMLFLMKLHIVNNTGYVSSMGRLRYTLGFENPNVAALFYSSAVYLLLVSQAKIKHVIIIISFFAACAVYYYTDSRTSFLALLVFIFLEEIYRLLCRKDYERAKRIYGKGAIIICDTLFALNLLSVFMIDKFMRFDKLLSFRISTFSKMIADAGWRGFFFGGTYHTVDNFYYMLLFQYGIFIYLFTAVATHFAIKNMIKNEDIRYVALLVGMLLVAMMESSLIRPEILVTLVFWKVVLAGKTDLSKQSKYIRNTVNEKQ